MKLWEKLAVKCGIGKIYKSEKRLYRPIPEYKPLEHQTDPVNLEIKERFENIESEISTIRTFLNKMNFGGKLNDKIIMVSSFNSTNQETVDKFRTKKSDSDLFKEFTNINMGKPFSIKPDQTNDIIKESEISAILGKFKQKNSIIIDPSKEKLAKNIDEKNGYKNSIHYRNRMAKNAFNRFIDANTKSDNPDQAADLQEMCDKKATQIDIAQNGRLTDKEIDLLLNKMKNISEPEEEFIDIEVPVMVSCKNCYKLNILNYNFCPNCGIYLSKTAGITE